MQAPHVKSPRCAGLPRPQFHNYQSPHAESTEGKALCHFSHLYTISQYQKRKKKLPIFIDEAQLIKYTFFVFFMHSHTMKGVNFFIPKMGFIAREVLNSPKSIDLCTDLILVSNHFAYHGPVEQLVLSKQWYYRLTWTIVCINLRLGCSVNLLQVAHHLSQ